MRHFERVHTKLRNGREPSRTSLCRQLGVGLTDLPAGQPTGLGVGAGQLLAPVDAAGRALAHLGAALLPVERRHARVRVLRNQIVRHFARLAPDHAPVRAARAAATAAAHAAPAVHQAHGARATRVPLARRRHLGHGRGRGGGLLGLGRVAGESAQRHAGLGRRVGGQPRAKAVRRRAGRHVRPVQARAQQLQTVVPETESTRRSVRTSASRNVKIRVDFNVLT